VGEEASQKGNVKEGFAQVVEIRVRRSVGIERTLRHVYRALSRDRLDVGSTLLQRLLDAEVEQAAHVVPFREALDQLGRQRRAQPRNPVSKVGAEPQPSDIALRLDD